LKKLSSLIILLSIGLLACQKKDDNSTSPPVVVSSPTEQYVSQYLSATGEHVAQVSVNGQRCGANSYVNEPCVAIKLCLPGTNFCQIIDNILLDTGSYGLRVFKSTLSLNFPNLTNSANRPYGTCALFGSGASWGSMARADIVLGNVFSSGIKANNIPFQIIDANFAQSATLCNDGEVDESPATAGFNGILGVGFFAQDCGPGCANNVNNGLYFSCTGNSCTDTAMPLSGQTTNPVPFLSTHNNGYVIALPPVSPSGATSVEGVWILGIETATNNQPYPGINTITTSSNYGYSQAIYQTRTTYGLLDTGTNGYAFFDSTLPTCNRFYCVTGSFTVSMLGYNNLAIQVPFNLVNLNSLSNSKNVFNNIAFQLEAEDNIFILGLPFFLGKVIFFGVEGGASTLGNSYYWAW
jgi:hypothetical protein